MTAYLFPRIVMSDGSHDLGHPCATGRLEQLISGALPGRMFQVASSAESCSVVFPIPLDTAEQEALSNAVAQFRAELPDRMLVHMKAEKINDIDLRTDQLISTGVEFPPGSGMRHSLSDASQAKIIGLYVVRDQISYPVRWNSIDDTAVITLNSAADVTAFFLEAVGTVRAHLDSGTALKDQVRADTTVQQVAAVVDSR